MPASSITASDWLAAWESGAGRSTAERALSLLRAACPGERPERLARLPIGRRDALLIELRAALFGVEVACVVSCPRCTEPLDLEFRIDRLRVAAGSDDGPGELALDRGEHHLRFRLPTSLDHARLDPSASVADARLALLRACVSQATHGADALPIESLPDDVVEALMAAMSSADPQAEVVLEVDCPACGHAWGADFDIAAFLWRELDAWARRLLLDIHTLARAYGWTERDVLALGPARRQAYLELAS